MRGFPSSPRTVFHPVMRLRPGQLFPIRSSIVVGLCLLAATAAFGFRTRTAEASQFRAAVTLRGGTGRAFRLETFGPSAALAGKALEGELAALEHTLRQHGEETLARHRASLDAQIQEGRRRLEIARRAELRTAPPGAAAPALVEARAAAERRLRELETGLANLHQKDVERGVRDALA